MVPPVFLVSTVTTMGLIQVFGRWEFVGPCLMMAGLVHLITASLRTTRLPAFIMHALSLYSIFIFMGFHRYRSTLSHGLPMSATWTAAWNDVHQAITLVGEVVTPVGFDSPFGACALMAVGLIALFTDVSASRYGGRIEVFVPSAAMLFVVAAVGTGRNRIMITTAWMAMVLVAAAYIRRQHLGRLRPTSSNTSMSAADVFSFFRTFTSIVLFAGFIGGLAALVGPQLPGARQEAWLTQRTRGGAATLLPLVDIRQQLEDTTQSVLFTVRAERPSYWRTVSLPDFDGTTWSVSQGLLDRSTGELVKPPGTNDSGVDIRYNLQQFVIETLRGALLPVAPSPTQLRAATQSVFFEPDTGSLIMGGAGLRPTDTYDIQSTIVIPRSDRLAKASTSSPPDSKYVALPQGEVTDALTRITRSIVPPGASAYEQALALQDYFRNSFTYALDAPVLSGSDAILQFLDRRNGYCVHFASTFAAMARTLGIPSRVAIGFTPGEATTSTADWTEYSVRPQHAHAWPEIWFDDVGWVLFEPTPGRGAPDTEYTNVPQEQDTSTPSTTTPPETISPTTSVDTVPDVSITEPPTPSLGTTSSDGSHRTAYVIVAVFVIIALWCSVFPVIARAFVEKEHFRAEVLLWRRIVALYEYERGPFDSSLSPIDIARVATSRLYDDDPFIEEVAGVVTRTLFGEREIGDELSVDLRDRGALYLKERRSRLPLGKRLRAGFDPFVILRLQGARPRSRRFGSRKASTG